MLSPSITDVDFNRVDAAFSASSRVEMYVNKLKKRELELTKKESCGSTYCYKLVVYNGDYPVFSEISSIKEGDVTRVVGDYKDGRTFHLDDAEPDDSDFTVYCSGTAGVTNGTLAKACISRDLKGVMRASYTVDLSSLLGRYDEYSSEAYCSDEGLCPVSGIHSNFNDTFFDVMEFRKKIGISCFSKPYLGYFYIVSGMFKGN